MSSPSRLANWSKTWSRSTSRMRWRMICLAVWAPIRPYFSPSSCSSSMTSPALASGLRLAGLVDGHLDHRVLDLVHDVLAAVHVDPAALRLDANEDVLLAGDAAIGGLDALLEGADERLSRDLLLGVELEQRTDEVTTHHVPPALLARWMQGVADTKKRGLVTHVPRRPCVIGGEYTPGQVDLSIGGAGEPREAASSEGPPRRPGVADASHAPTSCEVALRP